MAKSPKIHPVGEQIVVERKEAEQRSSGGIFLPDAAKEAPQEGVVVAVGRGRVTQKGRLIEPQLKPGDRVLFGRYGATEVDIDGKPYLFMVEADIRAVLED